MTQTSADAINRMRRAMEDDDGSPPPLWDPAPGEQLIGVLLRFEERYSQKMNADVRVAIVADIDSDDTWSVFLSRSVLRNEFEKQAPRPGDTVGIKYHGLKSSRGGSEYHHYTLRVARTADDTPPPPGGSPARMPPPPPDEADDELPF